MPAVIFLLLAAAKGALLIGGALLMVACMRRAPAARRHAVLVASVVGALALPLLGAALPTFSPVTTFGLPASAGPEWGRVADNALLLVLVRSDAVSGPPVQSSLRAMAESRHAGILTLWLAGTAVVLLRIGTDLLAASRARARAARRGSLGPGIPLLESAEIASPVAVGLFRPAVMIPRGARLERAAFVSVVAHELAHIRRRDCLTQLAVRLACAFSWFNPLAWYAAHRIALERERACDDLVLASGADPIAYAQLLVDMARRASPAVRYRAAPSVAQPAHLEKRIRSILDARPARGAGILTRRGHAALVLAALAVVAPLAALGVQDGPTPDMAEDPFADPRSERVAGHREAGRAPWPEDATTVDGALIAVLREAAAREPVGPGDLVPDRARWALSVAPDGRLIEPLIGALRHPDWRVRGYAAWALALSRDPRAVEPLIPLLDEPVWRLRAMAATALRQSGDPRAAEDLARALGDPAWQVRMEAVLYFGALREPRWKGTLERLRDDPHIAVRLAAHEALDAMP